MDSILMLLFLISIIFIPIAIINPKILSKITKQQLTRFQSVSIAIFISFTLLWGFVTVIEPTSTDKSERTSLPPQNTTEQTNANELDKVVIDEEIEQEETFMVKRVVDGDTIELENGERVRYIGIDTPETVHPTQEIQCYGVQASNKNKELVEGKKIRLEKDISEKDRFGRLLRYVYIDDIFVNEFLVREGYAKVSTYPPDVKYQEIFLTAENNARENNRGLWQECITNVAGATAVEPPITPAVTTSPALAAPATSPAPTPTQVVKKSRTDICHAPGTTYYDRTTNFTSYNTLSECLESGGRLPKR
jgi:micrococcal nuclease